MRGLFRVLAPGLLAAALQAQGPVQEFRLPSGLRCVLMEKHDQPHLRLELITRLDPAAEPPARQGLAGFLGAVLRAGGAGPYARPEFNRALDDLGLAFSFETRRNAFLWTLAAESRSQEPALELLADAVFRPSLDVPMVEAQRKERVKLAASASTRALGVNRFLWRLGDPACEFPAAPAPLQDLSYDELQAFRLRVLRPEASTLVLYGDLSLTQAKELVGLHFGLWHSWPQASPAGTPPAPAAPAEDPRFLASLDTGAEAEVWAGREAASCPLAVSELLGLLLEQVPAAVAPGLTRTCSLEYGRPLLVKIKAGAAARERLLEALRTTLEDLRTRGFSAEEVDRARLRWKARLAALPLHPQACLHRFNQGILDGDFAAKVDAVGAREINATLAALLAPDALRFLLLGGDGQLAKGAEQAGLGPVTLVQP